MPASNRERLKAFPRGKRKSAPPMQGGEIAWPKLAGNVSIAFASRAGSTFLCQEIERAYAVSDVREAFNEKPLLTIAKRHSLPSQKAALAWRINRGNEAGWFIAKAGLQAIIRAEKGGFYANYRACTHFLFLLRRDLIAQAISISSARITGQYHSTQIARGGLEDTSFDATLVGSAASEIYNVCSAILDYLITAQWPTAYVFYEDFKYGDTLTAFAWLDAVGVPRRGEPSNRGRPEVKRLERPAIADWAKRAQDTPAIMEEVERYDRLLHRVRAHFRHVSEPVSWADDYAGR